MNYVGRRLAQALMMISLLMVIVFFGGRVIGDPVDALAPPGASEQVREDIRVRYGFDRPVSTQFVEFVGNAARLDFGTSIWQGTPALDIVLDRLPNTLILAGVAMALIVPLSLLMGTLAAFSPGSLVDRLVSFISLSGVSMVEFWLGLMLIGLFAVQLGWLPTGGMDSPAAVILPAITIAFRGVGRLSQFVRSAMIEELGKTYIKMARSKGVSEWRIFLHAGRNASVAILTMAADEFSELASGTMVVETVFAWPGLGMLIVQSISLRDLYLLEASVFIIAVMIALINLLTDLSYARLNPQIRNQ
ncbi:MAG: ABC transporter permease [Paracoccaceae bacterium]